MKGENRRGRGGAPPGRVRVQVLRGACDSVCGSVTPPNRWPLTRLSQPLAGAPLPQSSETERRLKMGRRRPGSRLGDSEPLRLPELREPLR